MTALSRIPAPQASAKAAWTIVIGLSLGPAVSNGLARFAYGLILPAMRQDLAWSYTEAGWINTANALGYLLGALLALRTIGSIAPRLLFSVGMIVTTLALLGSALTRDLWLQSSCRLLAGLGGAPVLIAGSAIAATLFRDHGPRNALAIAIYFGGGGLGMLLSGLALPLLAERFGSEVWPIEWLVLAGMAAVATWPAITAARAAPQSHRGTGGEPAEPLPVGRMAFALAGYFLFAVGYIVYLTFLVAWMGTIGAGAAMIAATWSMLGIAVMLSPIPWRPALARSKGGGALALACLATGIGTLLPLIASGPVGVLLSALVFGASFFMGPSAVTAFARRSLPEASWGRSVALFTVVFALGQVLGPVAAGAIADATSSLTTGLGAAGGILMLGSILAAFQGPIHPAAYDAGESPALPSAPAARPIRPAARRSAPAPPGHAP